MATKLGLLNKIKILDPPYLDAKEYYIAVSKKYDGSEKNAQTLADLIDAQL